MKLGTLKDVFGGGCLILQLYLAGYSWFMLHNNMRPEELLTVLVVIGPVAAICVSTYVRYKFTAGLFADTKNPDDERIVNKSAVALAIVLIALVGGVLSLIILIYVAGGGITASGVKTAMVLVESLSGGGLPMVSEYIYRKDHTSPANSKGTDTTGNTAKAAATPKRNTKAKEGVTDASS